MLPGYVGGRITSTSAPIHTYVNTTPSHSPSGACAAASSSTPTTAQPLSHVRAFIARIALSTVTPYLTTTTKPLLPPYVVASTAPCHIAIRALTWTPGHKPRQQPTGHLLRLWCHGITASLVAAAPGSHLAPQSLHVGHGRTRIHPPA